MFLGSPAPPRVSRVVRLSQESHKVSWSTESFTPLTHHRILIKDVSYFLILFLSQEITNVIQQTLSIAALHIQWSYNQLADLNNSLTQNFLSLTTLLLHSLQPHCQLQLQPRHQVQAETEIFSLALTIILQVKE